MVEVLTKEETNTAINAVSGGVVVLEARMAALEAENIELKARIAKLEATTTTLPKSLKENVACLNEYIQQIPSTESS